jgi:hypothetical protein
MADSNIGALSRSSKDDLKITFEKDNETISVYIDPAKVKPGSIKIQDYIGCALCCSQKAGFAACMARCLLDGQCCDGGVRNCTPT